MLQHTTLDDFLRGLYINTVTTPVRPSRQGQTEQEKLLSFFTEGKEDAFRPDPTDRSGPTL